MKIKELYNKVFYRTIKTDLTYSEAMSIYKKYNAMLIDVRTPEEFKEGHIKGAINIPVYEFDNIKNEIIDKNKVILLYCKTGKRSKMGKEILTQSGYKNVYTLSV